MANSLRQFCTNTTAVFFDVISVQALSCSAYVLRYLFSVWSVCPSVSDLASAAELFLGSSAIRCLSFFFYKRPNTREFHENRPSDHYILDMTANEFPHVCSTFPCQSGRCPEWQFPTQCCTAVASSVKIGGVTAQITFWPHIPHLYHIWRGLSRYGRCPLVMVSVLTTTLIWWRKLIYTRVLHAWFQVYAALQIGSAVLWDRTKRGLVIPYRRFGTTYRSHPQASTSPRKQRLLEPWRWDR
jgi:hypothetical protein